VIERFLTSISPVQLARTLWRERGLILQLTRSDIAGRYKGSLLGIFWSLCNPIALLTIYTFVFSVVFQARWDTGDQSQGHYAVQLFAGMIVHGLFTETLLRSPSLILQNSSYVKKIIFPLEILPVMAVGTSAFHSAISIGVLAVVILIVAGGLPWTIVLLPFVLLPLMLMSLGFAWFLASLGVYLRDIIQPIGLLSTILLFSSPVFYPASALPDFIQPWLLLNPLTFPIEQSRAVLIVGVPPNVPGLLIYTVISVAIALLGNAWFQKTRRGFANVL
jgi:lipopolysaccharide transport system permease protein